MIADDRDLDCPLPMIAVIDALNKCFSDPKTTFIIFKISRTVYLMVTIVCKVFILVLFEIFLFYFAPFVPQIFK